MKGKSGFPRRRGDADVDRVPEGPRRPWERTQLGGGVVLGS